MSAHRLHRGEGAAPWTGSRPGRDLDRWGAGGWARRRAGPHAQGL